MKRGIILTIILILLVFAFFGCSSDRDPAEDKNRGAPDDAVSKLDAISIAKKDPKVSDVIKVKGDYTVNAVLSDKWTVEFTSGNEKIATVIVDSITGTVLDSNAIEIPEGYCEVDNDCPGDLVCIENSCAEASLAPVITEDPFAQFGDECEINSDCVPKDCCHSSECVPKEEAPDCSQILCTLECAPGTLDCGGQCICDFGNCKAQLNTLQ